MQLRSQEPLQIFLQSHDLHIPTRALTLTPTPSYTLRHLKRSLFPAADSPDLYFTLNGKPLQDSTPIVGSGVSPLSTLVLRCRLRGGGGDGGATGAESRDCYLNMYAVKKPDKVDPNEQRLSRWMNCALSCEPLREPCVVDKLGNIFNKQALVEALLGKKLPREFGYIKGLKDMVKIKLTEIPGLEDDVSGGGGARYQCPITGLEFNGKYKFFTLRTCGHVLSAKALKEVKSSSCLVCHEEFSELDKIAINGSEEEVAVLRERLEEERVKLRDKKAKKVKNGEVVACGEETTQLIGAKRGIDVNHVEKASVKVDENGKVKNGGVGVKGATSDAAKRFKAADMVPRNATKEVYASIFTSSKKGGFKETYSCRSLPLGRN
ncbi:replication termination factor 2 [Rhodamnia argentea]|uniref:Replication termination factor 2 n=1 Tax=Rhodamnia argentea TaxID=178133 RepID=A0A8B8NMD8_9MYRT|nr:replication termination factor 2 [Rhodamnia argentea]